MHGVRLRTIVAQAELEGDQVFHRRVALPLISQKMFPIILGTVVQRYELFEVILQLRHEATAPVAGLGMNPVQHGFNLLDNTLFAVLGHVGIMSVENEQQNFSSDVTRYVQTFEMTVEGVKFVKHLEMECVWIEIPEI